MTIFAAVVLALAVGITEIFPVSGTGHLYVLAKLLGVPASGAEFQSFRGMLYLGVAFSGILFYRAQLYDMAHENLVLLGLARPGSRQRGEPFGRRLGQLLMLATLPMLPALLLNGLRTEMEQGTHTLAIASGLFCLSGAVLYFASRGCGKAAYNGELRRSVFILGRGIAALDALCTGFGKDKKQQAREAKRRRQAALQNAA